MTRLTTLLLLVFHLLLLKLVTGGFVVPPKSITTQRRLLYRLDRRYVDQSCDKKISSSILLKADFEGGISSSFQGAGSPRVELSPEEIPPLLMEALKYNDVPEVDAGLKAMWEFAGGNTQFIFQYNRTDFIVSAHETAEQFPTSFYGVAMYGTSWEMETPLNRVGGSTGWIATQVMKTISSDGRMRRWQWELRKNRRPPNKDAWLVESIGSSDRKGNFEPD